VDRRRRTTQPATGLGLGIALVVVLTVVLLPFHSHVSRATPAMILVLPVVVSGLFGGRIAAVATAVIAAVAFSIGFIPPVGSLRVAVSDDAVALVVFVLIAVAIGTLVALEGDRWRAAELRTAEIQDMHLRYQALVADQDRLRKESDRLAVMEQIDAQRSALLRSVSHDLRTPLASIRAVASDLRSTATYDAPVRDELLGLVCDEAERLDRIVANLLSLSRIESGAFLPDRQAVAVDELLGDLTKRLSRLFDGVVLDVEVPPSLPLVDIDYVQIDQVLANLLENAARHAPPGSRVLVSVEAANTEVAVIVSDEGPGVDPGEVDHIFEPFRTGRPSTTSGVGLAICKAIVEAHGGRITATNNAKGGARFHLTLPVRTEGPAPHG
jgi:two-component system sensor histidine kinase KdpD